MILKAQFKGGFVMKKHLFSFSLFIILFSAILFSQSQEDQIVYVTRTGSKYHSAGCSYLKRSSIPMKLSEASAKYSPCSRCAPPVLSTLSKKKSTSKIQKNSSTSSKETQIGTTPTGKTLYQGPRGGIYHYSKSGRKVYQKKY